MKKLMLLLLLMICISVESIVNARSITSNIIGNFTYHNTSHGTYVTQKIGDNYYTTGPNTSFTTKSYLETYYYIYISNSPIINCYTIGSHTYFNTHNGTYTAQTIGNFDYVHGPNGYHGTGQQIGNFYYYND